jgi:hypothetical protein
VSYVEIPPGTRSAGCARCGEVFTSNSTFDQHWAGWAKRGGACQHPAAAGLVPVRVAQNGATVWGGPGGYWPTKAGTEGAEGL